MNENPVRLVYCPCADQDEARAIATAMVTQRLAACANILPAIESIYRWEGSVATDAEVPVLFKTDAKHCSALLEGIAALHSYDVPAIIAWDAADCPAGFRQWLDGQLSRGA